MKPPAPAGTRPIQSQDTDYLRLNADVYRIASSKGRLPLVSGFDDAKKN
jgi:hypothetical protein